MSERRLSFFVPTLVVGGVQRSMIVLANGFAARGYDVDLVLDRATGLLVTEVSSQVRVVELGADRVLQSIPKLARYLRREDPYALVTGMTHVNLAAVWARMLARCSTRVIVSERIDRQNVTSIPFYFRLISLLAIPTYRLADGVVGVSKGVSKYVSSAFHLDAASITTIYNPIDVSRILARAVEPLPDDVPDETDGALIVAAGRLVAQKDFTTLLKAFAHIRPRIGGRLVILGDGPLRGELEQLAEQLGIRERVHFAGSVANPYNWMRRADLFVLSSRHEGLGNVIIEAMACGTPIVSTDCPSGPREILEDGKWGRLVPPAAPELLGEAMALTLADPNPPDVTTRAADFDIANILADYLRVLLPEADDAPLQVDAIGGQL